MTTRHQHDLPFARPQGPTRRPPPQSVRELEVRAAALEGRTVAEVAAALGVSLPDAPRRAKGFVGQLAERALGADPTAADRPDFPELGVELKTIPVRDDGVPSESTFCCSVSMGESDRAEWETSRLRLRLQHVLWLPVDATTTGPLPARRFGRARLWAPQAEELAALRNDWEDLMGALGSGHSPSGREGAILQLRPKGADASVRAVAPAEDGARSTLPLAFYLRASFTAVILRGA